MEPLYIAFGHRKRTGKDTAGGMLHRYLKELAPELNVAEVSFAAKLKQISYDLFKWAGLQPGPFYEIPENAHLREVVLPAIGKTPRQIWIEVGNKLREVCPDVWVQNALFVDGADIVIVRDLRYGNECDIIEQKGGRRYKMIRDAAPVSNDVADCDLDSYDRWTGKFYNNGTLDELGVQMRALARDILHDLATKRYGLECFQICSPN